nr:S41 family peptidase [uncultured Psychroserpens sp.]
MKKLLLYICFIIISLSGNAQDLTKKEIKAIISKIPELILEHYVLTEKKLEISDAFTQNIKSKIYQNFINPDSLANKLTKDLRTISNDKHLSVEYLKTEDDKKDFDWDDWEKKERALELTQNFGFTEIKILEENIGYLKIVEFMHSQRGMQTAVATMKLIENTKGLIIDLRGNGGGYSGLMMYILNHYFDGGPTHISTTFYSDKNSIPDKEYSSDLVYGKLRVNTPLYIIINEKTGSAAEFLAYTLQAFGKAKIVGKSSAGAAHMNSFYTLNNRFRISISTAAPINPITNTNWENIGVIPDYEIEDEIVNKALKLLLDEQDKY